MTTIATTGDDNGPPASTMMTLHHTVFFFSLYSRKRASLADIDDRPSDNTRIWHQSRAEQRRATKPPFRGLPEVELTYPSSPGTLKNT